jgi:hypothetical protein
MNEPFSSIYADCYDAVYQDKNYEAECDLIEMFAVLGCQLDNSDVVASLGGARRHLRPSGLLFFEVWYGPAVLHQRPSRADKNHTHAGGENRASFVERFRYTPRSLRYPLSGAKIHG